MGLTWGIRLVVLAAIVSCLAWWHNHQYDRGYQKRDQEVALERKDATEKAFEDYRRLMDWGAEISGRLIEAEARNKVHEVQYVEKAYTIRGMCPDSLRVLHDAAAAGMPLPETASPPAEETGVIAASAVGVAISRNYTTCRDAIDQLTALIAWHEGVLSGPPK